MTFDWHLITEICVSAGSFVGSAVGGYFASRASAREIKAQNPALDWQSGRLRDVIVALRTRSLPPPPSDPPRLASGHDFTIDPETQALIDAEVERNRRGS